MSQIQIIATLHLEPGAAETFSDIARRAVAIVREKDTGTVRYDWHVSDDGATACVLECYEDGAALLAHAANVGSILGELRSVLDGRAQALVIGDVSDDLRGLLGTLRPTYCKLVAAP